MVHGDAGGDAIGEHHGDEEGADTAVALPKHGLRRFKGAENPAHAIADDDPNRSFLGLAEGVELGIAQGLLGRGKAVLGDSVHAPGIFAAEERFRVKVAHFPPDLGFVTAGVEIGDSADAALASGRFLPCAGHIIAQRVDRAQPCNDDSSVLVAFHACSLGAVSHQLVSFQLVVGDGES